MSEGCLCIHLKEMWKQNVIYTAYNRNKDAAGCGLFFQENSVELEIKKNRSL